MKRWRRAYTTLIIGLLVLTYFYSNLFPGNFSGIITDSGKKPIILYYNYGEKPFNASEFPDVVSFASLHGFNTLMLLVYDNHHPFFNSSTLEEFFSYSRTQNITFVPSYYIQSLEDTINTSGFSWINLDMERLSQPEQRAYFDLINATVPLVSVTMPYGVSNLFHTRMLIVESYSGGAVFWLEQMAYSHYGTICSVHVASLSSRQEYLSQFEYCLKYSDGVMVFEYPSLQNSGY